MEALQLDPKKKTLSLNKIDIPNPTDPEDVIIKVAYAGVCGTDLHIIGGEFPCMDHSFALGHEFCGTVYKVGSEVKTVKPGDRVGVDPNKGCGACKYCHTGSYHLCPDGGLNSTIGIFHNGGWAQYCRVPSKQVYKIPDGISFKQAVLLEPLSCIYHAYSRIGPLHYSSNILVTGAGIAGNLWCTLLHHVGHRNVTVSEPEEGRQALVKRLETGFNITHPKDLPNLFSTDGINGADVCIDCSGNGRALESNLSVLNRGGKLCIFGVASPETKINVSPFEIFLRELTIYGVTINRYAFEHAVGLMEAMGSRYMDYKRLGIEVFTIKQYKEALDALKQSKISKAVFKIDPDVE